MISYVIISTRNCEVAQEVLVQSCLQEWRKTPVNMVFGLQPYRRDTITTDIIIYGEHLEKLFSMSKMQSKLWNKKDESKTVTKWVSFHNTSCRVNDHRTNRSHDRRIYVYVQIFSMPIWQLIRKVSKLKTFLTYSEFVKYVQKGRMSLKNLLSSENIQKIQSRMIIQFFWAAVISFIFILSWSL